MTTISSPPSSRAYDQTAPFYDAFTAHHDYELWVGNLLAAAAPHGVSHGRVLDVGCGTGKSLEPFLRRGWRGTGCDASAGMLERARARLGPRAELFGADVTELPSVGRFDLVVALDDVVNHVCQPDDLAAAFTGLAANLAAHGRLLFDVNTLATYRGFFAETSWIESADLVLVWRGRGSDAVSAGQQVAGCLDAFALEQDGRWSRTSAVHHQCHHPESVLRHALAEAGLEVVALLGQDLRARLEPGVDELRHTKAVYIVRHAHALEGGR